MREKFVSKLGFEPQISSFTHRRLNQLDHRDTYTNSNTLDNGLSPTNLCYKSNIIVTNISSFRYKVRKTGDLRFKSQLRHKFFSQYSSSYSTTVNVKLPSSSLDVFSIMTKWYRGKCGLNFLTFFYNWGKPPKPWNRSDRKVNPGRVAWEATGEVNLSWVIE